MRQDRSYDKVFFCTRNIWEVIFAITICEMLNAEKHVLIFFVDGPGGRKDKDLLAEIIKLSPWNGVVYIEGLVASAHEPANAGWYKKFKYGVKYQLFNRCSIRELLESSLGTDVFAGKGAGSAVFFTDCVHILDQNVIGIMPEAERCWFASGPGKPHQDDLEKHPGEFRVRGRLARKASSRGMTAVSLFQASIIKYIFRLTGKGKYVVPFDGTDRVYALSDCGLSVPFTRISVDNLKQTVKLIRESCRVTEEVENSIHNILSGN